MGASSFATNTGAFIVGNSLKTVKSVLGALPPLLTSFKTEALAGAAAFLLCEMLLALPRSFALLVLALGLAADFIFVSSPRRGGKR